MGLWSKVKGVFGRIPAGIKTMYNWVKEHLGDIKGVAEQAKQLIPSQYRPAIDGALDKGFGAADKVIRRFG